MNCQTFSLNYCPITGSLMDLPILPLYILAGTPMGEDGLGFVIILPIYNSIIGFLIGLLLNFLFKKIKWWKIGK